MSYGYSGKVLEINLTTGKISERQVPDEYYRKYLGGSGVAAKILYDEFDYTVDPLSPENPLIYMTGLLTGITVPTGAKSSFITKAPLTGIWGESTVGGHWGNQFKRTGYDGMIITGKSEKPVYIWINDGKVEIRSAEHVMGKDTFETSDILRSETDEKAVVACIGPAGERLNKTAGIMIGGNETRAAGRGGLGAVMGSKNLKAFVARGTQAPKIKDPARLKANLKEYLPELKVISKGFYDYGTGGGTEGVEADGDLPIKNWTLGSWAEGASKTCTQYMEAEGLLVGHHACWGCPIRCASDARVDVGPYKGATGHSPEYETIAAFGSNILNDDVRYVIAANDLCNRYGLDTIETGNAVSMAIECYERGLLTKEDTNGLELKWGDGPAVLELIKKIAYREEGIGETLADGPLIGARRIGGIAEEFVIHVKGQSLPMHDPRAFTSMLANYCTANRGACHLEAFSYFAEGGGFDMKLLKFDKPFEKHSDENKGELAKVLQDYMNIFNALGMCKFIMCMNTPLENTTEWINAVTGWDVTEDELLEIGERLFNLKRMYNVRLGISRKDDKLPPRLLTHDRETGGAAGILGNMGRIMHEYYGFRGWNEEGIPTPEKLKELGLDFTIDNKILVGKN